MKKVGILFFIFFSLCCSCNAKEVKFIQVTDTHLTQTNQQNLKDLVRDINHNYRDINFVIFTGDNLDKADKKDLMTFLDIIKRLNAKTYVIAGNHDLLKFQNMTKSDYMSAVRKKLGGYHSKKANYVFKQGNLVFITMSGVKEVFPGANGYFKNDEILWLDKKLTKYKNKNVVIFQHFPIIDSKVYGHNLYKKDDYVKVLFKHNNVIAIVSGHYHENLEVKENNIHHIITQNFTNNMSYKLITIDDETGEIYTFLIDTKDKFD